MCVSVLLVAHVLQSSLSRRFHASSSRSTEVPAGCRAAAGLLSPLGAQVGLPPRPTPLPEPLLSGAVASGPRPRLPGSAGDHGTSNRGLVRPEALTR